MRTAKVLEKSINSVGNQNWGSCEIVIGVPMQINSKLLYLKKKNKVKRKLVKRKVSYYNHLFFHFICCSFPMENPCPLVDRTISFYEF